jgi:hypothetical protein
LNLLMRSQDSPRAAEGGPRERPWPGIVVLVAALAPALAALAAVPWFVTQDGPAHLYNAEILARSFDPESSFQPTYRVSWDPLPNWAGHLVLAGLRSIVPARGANLAINALTLAGFAASVLWLRRAVAGPRGLGVAALLSALLGLNVAWLLGFTSFLLGACLFPLTLGVWWAGRRGLDWRRVAMLSALLVLGYFGHLVSLGLTVVGLAVLALLTPTTRQGREGCRAWAGRLLRTAVSTLPLIPLGLIYLHMTRRGGRMSPVWGHLTDPLSARAWAAQLGWADPISIAAKSAPPFGAGPTRAAGLLAPVAWLLVALGLAVAATLRARAADPDRNRAATERRGWAALAALLILGGLAGPDTLGVSHGHYLPQRIVLLGLVALVPALDLDLRRRAIQGSALALVVALAIQSALVWDYALVSQRTAGTIVQARGAVGQGRRIATLLVRHPGRFRANPLLHADCLLGLDTGNVIWSNYETRHYYFPVQFRTGFDRPDAAELERLALQDDPRDADARAEGWGRLLRRHHEAIDVLVVWGGEPRLDAINARWFRPVSEDGPLRILRHR